MPARIDPVRRRVLGPCAAAAVLCAGASPAYSDFPDPHPADGRTRVALVVGNAGYSPDVGPLKNPLHDAEDMCTTLRGLGFRATCFLDIPTRARLKAVIQDFIEATPPDAIAFVFYAGHAVQLSGENYLVPTGAQLRVESAVAKESVGVSYLMDALRQARTYLNVIVLDACRNNPWALDQSAHSRELAPIQDAPNAMVLYATAADDVAADGNGRNGIMTKNILAAIHQPGTVEDLFRQVSQGVYKDTQALGRPQEPGLHVTFNAQYCLVVCTSEEQLKEKLNQETIRATALKSRLDAGDRTVESELARIQDEKTRLQRQLDSEKSDAKKKQRDSFVPPSF